MRARDTAWGRLWIIIIWMVLCIGGLIGMGLSIQSTEPQLDQLQDSLDTMNKRLDEIEAEWEKR